MNISVDGHNLNIEQVWKITSGCDSFEIPKDSKKRMTESRQLIDKIVQDGKRTIYGINTGFGPLSGSRVGDDELEQHQVNLLSHLSTGQGDLFPPFETRAIMLARANALARGYSGIRVEVVDLLLELIKKDIIPEIPSEGSVGASGDLVPLGHMAQVLTGRGWATYNNERLSGADALKKAGLKPVVLQAKEGLALVNGTSVMTGLMALAVHETDSILNWMEFLSSCLFQVMYGSPEVLCGQLHHARGHQGQILAAERMIAHLREHPDFSKKIDDHQWGIPDQPVREGVEIQDPYSMRCSPQIIGACRDSLWHVEYMVKQELNASTDNPLVFAETETVIHGGNFYGQQMSMAADYLRLALVKTGLLADRQIDRLLNWRYSQGLPPMLSGSKSGLNSGMAGCQLLATSLAAEAKVLSNPASIQSIPTNGNNQDIVSMGLTAARYTRKTIPIIWKIMAVEAIALAQAAELREDDNVMGTGYAAFVKKIREVSPKLVDDRPLHEEIAKVTQLLMDGDMQKEFLGELPSNPFLSGEKQ